MNRLLILAMDLTVGVVALSAAVFAWMKYAMTSDDPFAVANHPMQPAMLAIHVVAAPLLVFFLGWFASAHVLPMLQRTERRRRRSGLTSVWLIAPMIASGYLLQVSTAEGTRKAMEIGHWVASVVFVLGYLSHRLAPRRPAVQGAPEAGR